MQKPVHTHFTTTPCHRSFPPQKNKNKTKNKKEENAMHGLNKPEKRLQPHQIIHILVQTNSRLLLSHTKHKLVHLLFLHCYMHYLKETIETSLLEDYSIIKTSFFPLKFIHTYLLVPPCKIPYMHTKFNISFLNIQAQ